MSRRRFICIPSSVVVVLLWILVPEVEARQSEPGSGQPLEPRSFAAQPSVSHSAKAQPPAALPLEADRELLRQAMLEARIATDRSRPGLTSWARDAGLAFSRWVGGWMESALPGINQWLAPLLEPALTVLLTLLATLLLALAVRFAFEHWRRRLPVEASAPVQHLGITADEAAARDWEGELRRCLGKGDVAASIEALWWWLANGLVADRAEPSWTSRELVVRAGRRDLLADVRRLDRMMYGATQPQVSEVNRLWSDLRKALG